MNEIQIFLKYAYSCFKKAYKINKKYSKTLINIGNCLSLKDKNLFAIKAYEKALINALHSNKVSFAALDVFVGEPKPSKELLNNEKISLTPHIGAATLEAQDRIGEELAEKIINFYKK